jgi:hypothetical protein
MTFHRDRLPDPKNYFESEGLQLTGPSSAKWKTTRCSFHGGSDSLRVNVTSGAFKCMNCGAGGGDVLAFHIQAHGLDFVQAAKALGAWVDDGKTQQAHKPTALSPRSALEVLAFESMVTAVAAGNMAQGKPLSDADRSRLMLSTGRINMIARDYQ